MLDYLYSWTGPLLSIFSFTGTAMCALFALFCFVGLVLYMLFDVNYFLRAGFLIAYGKIFKRKRGIFDTTSIGGWCTTQDLDIFMRHMNNARFFRDLDFGRFDFYFRTGLYTEITKLKGHALQGASTIRYRRPIPLFSFYKVQTQLIYWEEKNFYLEHKFVTSDGFVRAVVISKQTTINVSATDLVKAIAKDDYKDPVMPKELEEYLKSLETMSDKLRKKEN